MLGNNYKRSINIANGKHQLQKVCKHFGSFLKSVNDNKCNMTITPKGQ